MDKILQTIRINTNITFLTELRQIKYNSIAYPITNYTNQAEIEATNLYQRKIITKQNYIKPIEYDVKETFNNFRSL